MKSLKIIAAIALMFPRLAFSEGLFSLDGKTYSTSDLSLAQQQQFFELQLQAFEQQKSLVDGALFDIYLNDEAQKQKKSREDIEKKILDVKEPSEKQVKTWYEENKSRIPPNYQFDQIKGEIVKIVKQEEMK